MRIRLNGAERECAEETTIGRLVDEAVHDRSRVAVERNRAIVKRDAWDATNVEDGDVIEIVTLAGGG